MILHFAKSLRTSSEPSIKSIKASNIVGSKNTNKPTNNLITKEVISLEKSLSSETTAFAIEITPVIINIIGTSIFAILNKIAINFNTLTTFSFVQEKASKPSLANI
jgi:hypothetical protein